MKTGIIVVGYNRLDGLKRLLHSLESAFYDGDKPTLILSIDNSGSKIVENFVHEYKWPHGDKVVRTFLENQGLKKHILSCGDYFQVFDELIVLEDDMFVAPSFYIYAKQAGEFYCDDMNIAGISLYQHLYCIDASRPFIPMNMGADVYFMKYAQSWGEIWLKKQWVEFKSWYDDNHDIFNSHPDLPENVCNWSKSSWLKYHIRYCVEKNKYFVYPYVSQATCFSDVGVHSKRQTSKLQVPIQYGICDQFKLVRLDPMDDHCVIYDQYFENEQLSRKLCIDCDVDLYGRRKSTNKRYLLTLKKMNYKIEKSWGLTLRPMEANIIYDIQGDNIYLYDTTQYDSNHKKDNDIFVWWYDNRTEGLIKQEATVLCKEILQRLFDKIRSKR